MLTKVVPKPNKRSNYYATCNITSLSFSSCLFGLFHGHYAWNFLYNAEKWVVIFWQALHSLHVKYSSQPVGSTSLLSFFQMALSFPIHFSRNPNCASLYNFDWYFLSFFMRWWKVRTLWSVFIGKNNFPKSYLLLSS